MGTDCLSGSAVICLACLERALGYKLDRDWIEEFVGTRISSPVPFRSDFSRHIIGGRVRGYGRSYSCWIAALLACELGAQDPAATLAGTVLDGSGALVPRAKVEIRNISSP